MQVLDYNSSIPAFPIHSHIEAAAKAISPAERKQVTATHAELQRLNGISAKFQPQKPGQPHLLNPEIQAAEAALTANPSEALALELHELLVRRENLAHSSLNVSLAIGASVRVTIDSMIPIAVNLIDRAEADFLAEAAAHREATKQQTSFAAPPVDFDSRLEASRAAFAEKRRWIQNENASAAFLVGELAIGVK